MVHILFLNSFYWQCLKQAEPLVFLKLEGNIFLKTLLHDNQGKKPKNRELNFLINSSLPYIAFLHTLHILINSNFLNHGSVLLHRVILTNIQ